LLPEADRELETLEDDSTLRNLSLNLIQGNTICGVVLMPRFLEIRSSGDPYNPVLSAAKILLSVV